LFKYRLVDGRISVVVLAAGWAFGGIVGIGTVLYALGIGPIAHVLMPWFALDKGRGTVFEKVDDLEGH
jgi:uncharacterized membrane protein YczE